MRKERAEILGNAPGPVNAPGPATDPYRMAAPASESAHYLVLPDTFIDGVARHSDPTRGAHTRAIFNIDGIHHHPLVVPEFHIEEREDGSGHYAVEHTPAMAARLRLAGGDIGDDVD